MGADYAELMRDVADHLLGQPNQEFTTKTEWRYGSRGSLVIDLDKGTFFDHERGEGGGVIDLIQRERGGDKGEAHQWLVDQGLIEPKPNGAWSDRVVASYQYRDAAGQLIYVVVRLKDPKDFRQYRPHPTLPDQRVWGLKGGDFVQHQNEQVNWIKATKERTRQKGFTKTLTLKDNVQHTLFNLQQIANRDMLAVVYLPEGEKDCLTLGGYGFLATTRASCFWVYA
jgi:hypothetical protein